MSSKARLIGLLLVLVLGLLAGCKRQAKTDLTKAYAIERTYERGPLTARLRIDNDKINIAQTVQLELETQFPSQYRPQMPKIDPLLQDLSLVDWDSLPDRLADDGRVIKVHRYRFEPIISGSYKIPVFEFRFVDVNDPNAIYTIQTEPVDIHVASLLPQDRDKLTIEDIEPVVQIRPSKSLTWLAVALPVAVVAGLLGWVYHRKARLRKMAVLFRPAHELAYQRLQELLDKRLLDAGKVKEFYEGISHILRHYIEDRFQIHAPEQTTEEFLYNLKQTDLLGLHDRHDLVEFLSHCDLVKFARLQPSTEQIQRTFDLAKAFIERTASPQHVVEVHGERIW